MSAEAKQIRRLTAYAGRLIPSYGDITTGPDTLDLLALDLTTPTSWSTLATLDTQQILVLRGDGDTLLVPYLDPEASVENPEHGQYAIVQPDGAVAVVTTVRPVPVHVFAASDDGTTLRLYGSSQADGITGSATIWASTDSGATWTVELHVPSGTGWDESTGAGARFYDVETYDDGVLIAHMLGAPEARTYRREAGGSSWVLVDDPLADYVGNGVLTGFTRGGVRYYLNIQNGTVTTRAENTTGLAAVQALIPSGVLDASVGDDGALWLLTLEPAVWRLPDTGAVEKRAVLADNTARSLTVAGGRLWIGTTAGRIGYAVTP